MRNSNYSYEFAPYLYGGSIAGLQSTWTVMIQASKHWTHWPYICEIVELCARSLGPRSVLQLNQLKQQYRCNDIISNR